MRISVQLTIAWLCMSFSFGVAAQDRATQLVSQGEEKYQKAVQHLLDELEDEIDTKIDFASRSGNLDLVIVLKDQKRLLIEKQQIPAHKSLSSAASRYQRSLERESEKLIRIYEFAIKESTKASNIDAAKSIQTKIEKLNPSPELVIQDAQHTSVPKLGEKEFSNGRLREVWGDQVGEWIDLSVIDDTLQESMIGGRGHIQFKDGKLRETWGQRHGQWIDLTVVNDQLQESVVNRRGHIQYQNGKLREVYGKKAGKWIQIRELKRKPVVFEDDIIQLLKTATIHHNNQIVGERKKLQSTILKANEEASVTEAEDAYRQEVTSIKNKYIAELQDVLATAVAEERMDEASKIKVQILRVKTQIERLSREQAEPDLPALDDGNEDDPAPDQQPPAREDDQPDDDVAPDPASEEQVDFFGLPLE